MISVGLKACKCKGNSDMLTLKQPEAAAHQEYPSMSVLKEKLLQAIRSESGFDLS